MEVILVIVGDNFSYFEMGTCKEGLSEKEFRIITQF
jgi:hypothetical protein